jgi:Glycosyl hydrolases family 16
MRPMRGRFTMLAAVAVAVLTPVGCVSAPAGQASDVQPVGAGTGWRLVNNLDGQGIYHTFHLRTLIGKDCNEPGSVSVDSLGNLKLTTHKNSDACAEVTSPWTVDPPSSPVRVDVFIEWRASIPLNSWAALWLTGGSPWPANGEIDVAEVLEAGQLCQTFHYGTPTDKHVIGGPGSCVGNIRSGTWHTYGVEWGNHSLTFYYDGDKVLVMGPYGSPDPVTTAPEQVLMDVVNAGWVGNSRPEASLYVNYVRTWRRNPPGRRAG